MKTTIEIFTPSKKLPSPEDSVVLAIYDDGVLWFTGQFDGEIWRLDDYMPLETPVLYWFIPPNPEQFSDADSDHSSPSSHVSHPSQI